MMRHNPTAKIKRKPGNIAKPVTTVHRRQQALRQQPRDSNPGHPNQGQHNNGQNDNDAAP
jgi:hypothetical protein